MEEQTQVSIIVPVYNGGKSLDQCLVAINQSIDSSFELIVVDNGSTDDSVAIAQAYTPHVLYCPGPSGPGAARNVGAEHACGEILFFVDADVVIRPNTLKRIVGNFLTHRDAAAVFGSYDDSPAAQNFLSQYKNLVHHFVHQGGKAEASTFWGGCGAIRKEVFKKMGGFDQEKYPMASIEDIEMGFRMKQAGFRIILDKTIQVKHLKEWRLGSLLRAEVFCRAIPWTKLILERKAMLNDLNLQGSQKVSAGLVGVSCLLVPMGFMYPFLWIPLVIILGMIWVLNYQLFRFFFRRRGLTFAARTFPMHLLYFFYSGATFALVWCQYLFNGKSKPAL